MIDIDLTDPDMVILSPNGALSESDFDMVAKAIDTRINETDRVPNLVVRLDRLPHWDSLGALTRHFNFVRMHQQIVAKIAVVGDSPLLSVVPEIADHFVKAKIRRFPATKLADAKAWARAAEDDPGYFEEIEGLPSDVVALRAVGIITAQDYHDMLLPLVEEKLKGHDKIKCLIVLDEEYTTYSADAAWSDMKFGVGHIRNFSRAALVTDIGWITKAAKLFMPLIPFAFETFPLAELENAKKWIKR
ncbi:MAG: STAS/SEC14 domain-containing protein [Azoarcus sp.]|jgi:hypothetical protein|nr:STAS/SEC14 domain-containing protein [Azoarcus sp.]